MSRPCPHCHGTGYAKHASSEEVLTWLNRTAREQGIAIAWDGCVASKDAAKLWRAFTGDTGSESSLANDRAGAGLIPYVKRPNGRAYYPLTGFAEFLASQA